MSEQAELVGSNRANEEALVSRRMTTYTVVGLTAEELRVAKERAWKLYCETTAGCLSARDFWDELSPAQQFYYLGEVMSSGTRRSAIIREQ